MAAQVAAMVGFLDAGAEVFDYGNSIRGEAQLAGYDRAFEFPGFVPAYIRPLFCEGKGPFRWAALSGDPKDIAVTDQAILDLFPQNEALARWIRLAEEKVHFQGLPARICWLGYGERHLAGLRFNELVASGDLSAPVVLGRDHLDCGSVASPYRETEAMADGSDAIADWPLLNALVNTASGASWVSIHHGGGVGIGRSIHAGQVCVADGTEQAGQKLERVLTNDPAMGVIRHTDAGYDKAADGRHRTRRPRPDGSLMSFAELWRELEPLGRDPGTGGYRRYSWTAADAQCRAWFTRQAERLGLAVEPDNNGNLWAWWGAARENAIVTGSHLDSVPDGGGYDGALGVASALAAVEMLKDKNFYPERALALALFTEEEGARFRVPCLGSRLMTGAIDPETARGLTDDDGVTLAAAMAAAGADASLLGPREDLLGRVGAFIELHVEQGRALAPLGAAVGLAKGIWPHGRWRLDFQGRADHAGTARLADRKDPMLPYARTVLAARRAAADSGALATIGKVIAEPGGANGVSSAVTAWLDARAPDEARLEKTVTAVRSASMRYSAECGVTLSVRQESYTPPVHFDQGLRDRIEGVLAAAGSHAPVLSTGAGHDAGVLAARVPAAMLFVRNPTGVSHSPAEHAEHADCEAGVRALALVLEDLAGQP